MSAREVPQRFAVAFSLAGEQRQLVLQVAQEVEAILGRATVFYDLWYEHHTAGSDADLLLQGIYGEQSELVVVCVSGAYGDKPWTLMEHRAIRARSMQAVTAEERRRILPLRVDDGDVEGLLFNEIVPDVRSRTAAETAGLIVARLQLVRGGSGGGAGAAEAAGPAWPGEPPELTWPMADHTHARAAFARLLSDPSPVRALLVRGPSEMGKTHMSKQMTRNAMALPGVACGRFDFKGTTNIGVEVEAFAQPLGIDAPPGHSLYERLSAIFTELRRQGRPTVLIFDTFEAAGETREWIERVLLAHLASAPWLRVVVIGQSIPHRLGQTWESFAEVLELTVPDPEHWFEYGRGNRGDEITLAFVTQAHQLAGGRATFLAGLFGPQA